MNWSNYVTQKRGDTKSRLKKSRADLIHIITEDYADYESFPWILYDTGIIFYHLMAGEMVFNYMQIAYYELDDK
jgi:hypothetical protein